MSKKATQNTLMISIIIPTRNRKEALKKCLLSLASLDFPQSGFEVIVIDDASTDRTSEMIEKMQTSLPYPLDYARHTEQKGISVSRNQAVRIAKGEIIVSTDDDCLFPANWLSLLTRPIISQYADMTGGPDKAPEGASFFSRCVDYLYTSFFGTGGLRHKKRFRLGRYFPKGCNMAVRKKAILQSGGFDEKLSPSEEIDLGYRISKLGYGIQYVPHAFVWHERKASLRGLMKKMFDIGFVRVFLIRKHKSVLQAGHLAPPLYMGLILILMGGAFFSPVSRFALGIMLSLYGFFVLLSGIHASIRLKNAKAFFVVPFLLLLHHFSHGAGFLLALVKKTDAPSRP